MKEVVAVDEIEVVKEVEVEPPASCLFPPPLSSPGMEIAEEVPYTTSCRALLIGIGADEQMVSRLPSWDTL